MPEFSTGVTLVLLISAALIAVVNAPRHAVWLLVIQSIVLVGVAVEVAMVSHTAGIYLSVAVTVVVKTLLVPGILLQVVKRTKAWDAGPMYLGRRNVLVLAVGLMLAAYALARPFSVTGTLMTGAYFPTSVAMIVTGALIMVVRKKALLQVIGLIVVENGIYTASMATTYGLPPVVELGIAFDLLITVLLLGSLAFHVGVATKTQDTSSLRRLRH